MSVLVLDASFIVARIFEEEAAANYEAAYLQFIQDGAHVPQLWHFEARNALAIGERRGRVSRSQAFQAYGVHQRIARHHRRPPPYHVIPA